MRNLPVGTDSPSKLVANDPLSADTMEEDAVNDSCAIGTDAQDTHFKGGSTELQRWSQQIHVAPFEPRARKEAAIGFAAVDIIISLLPPISELVT
jgi:hypothetical protein